jgi:hypothetical protein
VRRWSPSPAVQLPPLAWARARARARGGL